jgi:hypothetical protein
MWTPIPATLSPRRLLRRYEGVGCVNSIPPQITTFVRQDASWHVDHGVPRL